MKIEHVAIIAGLAYLVLSKQSSTSQGATTGDAAVWGASSGPAIPIPQNSSVQYATGAKTPPHYGTINAGQQIAGVQKQYGENVQMIANYQNNPLQIKVFPPGGGSHIETRSPTNQTEASQARLANLRDLVSRGQGNDDIDNAIRKLTGG